MECKLFPLDGGHQPILLPHAKTVTIGRGPSTRITDKRISREQVQLTADYESREVALKQLGSNPGAMGHSVIKQGTVIVLKPAETFSLLQKKFRYNIQFIDMTDPGSDTTPTKESRFGRHELYRKSDHLLNASPANSVGGRSDDEARSTDSEIDPEINGRVKTGKPIGRVSSFKKRIRQSFNRKKNRDPDQPDGLSDDGRCSGSDSETAPRETRKISPASAIMRVSQTELYLFGCDTAPCSPCNSDIDDSETDDTARRDFGDDLVHEINKVRDRTRTSTSNRSSLVIDVPLLALKGEAQWVSREGLLIYSGKDLCASSQIAGFDYDGTMVTTISGETFPEYADDWRTLYSNCKSKLNDLRNKGFKIAIFTNQKSLGKFNLTTEDFQRRIEQFEEYLEISIQCFISIRKDIYRKPSPGMWDLLCREFNHSMDVLLDKSLYVGDAAGRPEDFSLLQKEDHSCCDRCFARNVGVKFYTPEEFFDGTPTQTFNWPNFDPVSVYRNMSPLFPVHTILCASKQEIIVMVGWPASGKTTFLERHLLQQSDSYASCVTEDQCHTQLSNGRSVIIDSSNPDVQSRKRFIDIAKEKDISCRCFHMKTSEDHSRHNATFCELTSYEPDSSRISSKAFRQYNASFQIPTTEEGFEEVVPINFIPSFNDKSKERLYFSFLI